MSEITTNGVLQSDGTTRFLREKSWPVFNGRASTASTPVRAEFDREPGSPRSGPWLMDIPLEWRGARQMIVQTDGQRAILREQEPPSFGKPVEESLPSVLTPPPVCIPAEIFEVDADPVKNPYDIGDTLTLTAVVVGTAPFTYDWNGGAGTAPTFAFTVTDGNILGKDETGLGHIVITLLLKNACNTEGDFLSGSYPAKGTPPP